MDTTNRRERRAMLSGHWHKAQWYAIDHLRRLAWRNVRALAEHIANGGRDPLMPHYRGL